MRNRFNSFGIKPALLLLLGLPLFLFCAHQAKPENAQERKKIQIDQDSLKHDFNFIQYDLNVIEHPGNLNGLENFNSKLRTLLEEGTGRINIVHLGGSHVQAGTLSSRLRQHFISMDPVCRGSRGFFFPGKLGASNGPDYIKVNKSGLWEGSRSSVPSHRGPWGMSGFNASCQSSSDTLIIQAFDEDSIPYRFNRLKVFCQDYSKEHSLTWLGEVPCISIERQSWGYDLILAHETEAIELRVDNKPNEADVFSSHLEIKGFQLLEDKPGVSFHAIGINGSSAESYLKCDFGDFTHVYPDLVVMGLGINDAYMTEEAFDPEFFKANYLEIMDRIQKVNSKCEFLFLSNSDSYFQKKASNPNAIRVKEVMYEISTERNCAVWDLFEIMGGMESIKTWEKYGLAKKDKIHFTKAGYRLEADLLFEALMKDFLPTGTK